MPARLSSTGRRLHRVLLLVIAFALTGVLLAQHATPAHAYARTGAKWPSGTIPVLINQAYSGTATMWNTGRTRWYNTATPMNFPLWNGSGATPAVKLYDTNDSSVSWDGMSYWSPATGTLSSATGYLNYYYVRSYSADKADGVATHELGHILGLAHVSNCALMYPNTPYRSSCGANSPRQDDINGANAIYH